MHDKNRSDWSTKVAIVCCAVLIGLTPATAVRAVEPQQSSQASAPQAAAAQSEPTDTAALQEITVTAQRVEENIQKVPITVNAVTGAAAVQRGAIDVQTLSTVVPSIVNTGNTSNFTYIRGVGSANQSINNEAAVSTYIDGVYMPSSYGSFGNFNEFDVSRIEVLKGPQGTQFGRDTTGGVIQIITPDPRQELSSQWSVGYGNYDTLDATGYATGGITQSLAADLGVTYEDQMNGWGHDLCPSETAGVCSPSEASGTEQNLAARSKWLWTPFDGTKITAQGDYSLYRSTAGLEMMPGSIDPYDHLTTYEGDYNFVGQPYVFSVKQYGASLHIDQDFSNGLRFVSISSYRQLQGYEIHDNTRSPDNDLYTIAEDSHGSYQTQEFQLIDQNPGRITWLLGAYYFGDDVGYDPRTQTGSLVDSADFLQIYSNQTIRSYSGYAQETTELFDDTKLELGVRYTGETVEENGQYENADDQIVTSSDKITGATPYNSTLKYNPWTYRAALDHQFDQEVMGYLSFTHGFKSGGFNLPTPQRNPYLPENINSYEAGVKSEFLNQRIRLNASAYFYDYHDIQVVSVPGLVGQIFSNAGGAKANGIDADFEFAVTSRFKVLAGFGYLHAYYTQFPDAERYTIGGAGVIIPNAAGYSLPYAPRYSGNAGFSYTVPSSIGDFVFAPTVAYTDKYLFTTDTNFEIPRIIMVNAQAQWNSSAIPGFAVRLWGRNLANEYTYSSPVESTGGWYDAPAAPRMYGVTVLMKF